MTIALHVLGAAAIGSTDLTLVNQVNPSGQRVFTTTVADDKGEFVLHWNNGQCIAGGEQQVLGIGQHIVSGGGQQAAGGRWQAVDDVLVDADNDAPEGQFAAQYALPNDDYSEDPQITARCPLPNAPYSAQTNWTSDNSLACLLQSVKQAVWISGLDGLDDHDDEDS